MIVVQYSSAEGRGGACSSRIFIKHSKRSYTQLAYYGNGQVTNVSHKSHKMVGAGAHDSPLHINLIKPQEALHLWAQNAKMGRTPDPRTENFIMKTYSKGVKTK